MLTVLLEIIVATLAVFGVYCTVQVIAAIVFVPKNISTIIEVSSLEDLENIEQLILEASHCMFRYKKRKITVFIQREFYEKMKIEYLKEYERAKLTLEFNAIDQIIGEKIEKD